MERYGDFELLRLIATGGMAEIYLATHASSVEGFGGGQFSRTVVVKRMLPQLAVRPDFVQMFLDEARLAANLNHPNVVSVFNLGEVGGSYFIAMEFVDGPHLGSLFAHSLRQRKPLPIEHCAYVVARAADGLHYAHEQLDPATGSALSIVHRDISPQNVLVSRQGDVKVTDFGVAKASTQQTKTRTGIIKGKVAYMSPEQCLGEVVDRRTDVFALGIVLYELLTRRRLFRDKSDLLIMQKITGEDVAPPSTVNKELDAELDAICLRALARDRERRYQSAAELAEALDAWLTARRQGDPRAHLQRWFEQHALELAIGTTIEEPSAGHTAHMRPAPGEATAATPSLNSTETVMRPAAEAGRASGADRPERSLPDRSHVADEPTQRAPRPTATDPGAPDVGDGDTLFGLAPAAGMAARDAATDEGPAVTAPAALAPGPDSEEGDDGEAAALAVPAAAPLPRAAMIGGGVLAALLVLIGAAVVATRGGDAAEDPRVAAALAVDAGAAGSGDPEAARATDGATARITVESVPPGVTVLLDDERVVGKTPVTFEHAPGAVKLQAQFADQPPVNEEIVVERGEERVVRLLAKTPLIVKSAPSKAKVRVNGELLGETPFERNGVIDPEKPVKIKLELLGWDFPERTLTPQAGAPLVVEMQGARLASRAAAQTPQAPRFGNLNMRSAPWVAVKVRGALLGNTTFTNAKVPAGRQVLVMTNPEVGINETLTVVIPEDKTLNVSLEWEKKGNDWRIKSRSIK